MLNLFASLSIAVAHTIWYRRLPVVVAVQLLLTAVVNKEEGASLWFVGPHPLPPLLSERGLGRVIMNLKE